MQFKGTSRLVQTQGVTIELVSFVHNVDKNEYIVNVLGKDDYLLIRQPKRIRVQFEDGDWHTIPEGFWVCVHMEHSTIEDRECGVCAVMPTPEQAWVEGFNLYF